MGHIRHLSMYSGGLSSWAATKRYCRLAGTDGLRLLFADTLIEDEDLYRFLVEGAANIFGVSPDAVAPLVGLAKAIPPVEAGAWDERVATIASLRREADLVIPGLAWVADGRSPWEVFADERFIGNSRVDPCSRKLKRQLMDGWRASHCRNWRTTLVFGLGWSERGRIYGDARKPGHKRHMEESGWKATYPLDEKPYLTPADVEEWARSEGIEPPRLYGLGFPHNNCGGFCVKAGFGQMLLLLRTMPGRFRWHEEQEALAQAEIGTAETVLKYRETRRRKARNVTLRRFRELAERQPLLFDAHGGDGCGGGCAVDDEPPPDGP